MDAATLVYEIDSSQAAGAAKELLRMSRASADAATAGSKLMSMQRDVAGRFQSNAKYAEENSAAIKSLAAEFNPLMAAQIRFAELEQRAADAVRQGIISKQSAEDYLQSMSAQYMKAAQAQQVFAQGADNARHHVMNLGYQLNDIGMMMALGQNPFALMMQQGPQVAQIFAQMNAEGRKIGPTLAGAFTSILNPTTLVTLALIGGAAALTQWAFKGRDAAAANNTFADSLTGVADAANSYAMAVQVANQGSTALTAQYGAQAQELQRLYDLNVQLEQIKLGQAIRESAMEANAAYGDLGARLEKINDLIDYAARNEYVRADALATARGEMAMLNEEYGLSLGQAEDLNVALQAMSDANTIEEQAIAAEAFQQALLDAHAAGAIIPPELLKIASNAGVAAVALREMASAGREAAAAWASVGSNTGDFITSYENPNPIVPPTPPRVSRGGGGGGRASSGGGGGGSSGPSAADQLRDEMARRWEALNEGFQSEFNLRMQNYARDQETLSFALDQQFMTQQEFETKMQMLKTQTWGSEYEQTMLQYEMDQAALQQALDQKLITEQEYLERRKQLNWDAVMAVGQATDSSWAMQLDNLSSYMGQMNQVAGGGYDKLLKAQKVFAAASALISTYQGAAKALELPFPYNIAAAAKVIAAGMGFVSAIKSGGSSGGGGRASSAASVAQPARQEPTRTVLINLEGGTSRDREFAESIIRDIQEQSRDGRLIIRRDR